MTSAQHTQRRTSVTGTETDRSADRPIRQRTVMLALLLLMVATVVAYGPVLFNFFAGDDFVHLTWLRPAVQHPEMIWRNFYTSWLDGTTTKFYRPLISIFMVTDYLVWGINGLGFHITNLAFHCASSVILFFVVQRLASGPSGKGQQPASATIWALASAAIFALYPLHTEAVSWITGRVDSIVTTFCLAALWCYMRWRDGAGWGWGAGAAVTFICGLLSKEMAITTPALFVVYEFLIQSNTERRVSGADFGQRVQSWLVSGFVGSLRTLPFWAILAGYFVVRRMALGTFVGGYDDSLLFIADMKSFLLNWLHALRVFAEPINRDLFTGGNPTAKIWDGFVIAGLGLGIFRLCKERKFAALAFAFLWLLSALAPVYKLFAIADNLQGSRLAYLATVPLSILFAYGLTGGMFFSKEKLADRLRWLIPSAFAVLCGFVLFVNNQAWRQAGIEANAIRAELDRIYRFIKTDPQLMVIGLPDHIAGAYVSRNALFGMTKKPQISFDAYNCVMVNEFEPIFPFGFLKESLAQHNDIAHVMRWSKKQKKLELVVIPKRKLTEAVTFAGSSMQQLPSWEASKGTDITVDSEQRVIVSATTKKRPELSFGLPDNFPCWITDFISVKVTVEKPGNSAIGADLLYANDGNPDFELARRTHAAIAPTEGQQELLFVLRSLPEWGLGGEHPRFKLLLPPQSRVRIDSITVVPPAQLMPLIEFENSGYMGTKGYLHLSAKEPVKTVSIDAAAIPGAAGTMLEFTRPNMFFEEQNCQTLSKVQGKTMPGPLKGTVSLNRKDFNGEGIVEMRVWPIDKAGKPFGTVSDHIALSIDP